MKKQEHHEHTTTSTTLSTRARFMGHSCSFFCTRKTDTDVIDPKDTKPCAKDAPLEAIKAPEVHRTQSL